MLQQVYVIDTVRAKAKNSNILFINQLNLWLICCPF